MLCQGYNRSADYWAFGVLIFEMLTGAAPFAAKSDRERHAKILSAAITFPADFNLQAKDCVSRLCVLDISHRLGMMAGGVDELQDHTFFAEVDWHGMSTLQIKPPFVPRVRSQADWDARVPIKLPDVKEEALHPGALLTALLLSPAFAHPTRQRMSSCSATTNQCWTSMDTTTRVLLTQKPM